MNSYLVLKWLHVLSSVLLVGTGFGSAFYLFFANRSGKVAAIAVVSRLVVRADTWFTLPAVVFQPLSGLALIGIGRWQWDAPWILGALGLYFLAGACWLPVLWLQLRMRDLAVEAATRDTPLPARYRRLQRCWEGLGYPAFIAMVGAFFLMVVKPA